MTQIQSSNQDKSTNLFGKLSDRLQHMILVASSKGSVIPTEPSKESQAFFTLSSASKAQQFLENFLESNNIECTIQTAVANLWLNRCFLLSRPSQVKEDSNPSSHQDDDNKKRKYHQVLDNGTKAKIVTNKDQVKDSKYKEGENWQMWRNKTIKGPTLSTNSKLCLKYHVRGTCFDDCTNKASH